MTAISLASNPFLHMTNGKIGPRREPNLGYSEGKIEAQGNTGKQKWELRWC